MLWTRTVHVTTTAREDARGSSLVLQWRSRAGCQQAPRLLASLVLEARRMTGASLASMHMVERPVHQAHRRRGWAPRAVEDNVSDVMRAVAMAGCSMHVLRYRAPPHGRHNSLVRVSMRGNGWLQRVSRRRFLVGGVACARSWGTLGLPLAAAGAASRVSYPREQSLASPWSAFRLCFPTVPASQAAVCVNCILHAPPALPASMLPVAPSTSLGPHPAAPSPAHFHHHDRAPVA
jgi:hypothetical protein